MGGLGNQMFQYALGRRVSIENESQLKLDLSWFESQEKRQYQLSDFNIKAEIASSEDVLMITSSPEHRLLNKLSRITNLKIPSRLKIVWEEDNSGVFSDDVLSCPDTCILIGYWQSEKYFKPIEDILRCDFTLNVKMSDNDSALCSLISEEKNSVSLHVRRGDYVTESVDHFLCPIDYYRKAINYFEQYIIEPKFFIFSDDIEWAKGNLIGYENMVFIEPSFQRNDAVEMIMMSKCHHHVNANSSFSWWGAWIGERNDSIVIVPDHWFTNRPFPEDRVPKRWIRL